MQYHCWGIQLRLNLRLYAATTCYPTVRQRSVQFFRNLKKSSNFVLRRHCDVCGKLKYEMCFAAVDEFHFRCAVSRKFRMTYNMFNECSVSAVCRYYCVRLWLLIFLNSISLLVFHLLVYGCAASLGEIKKSGAFNRAPWLMWLHEFSLH